MSVLRLAEFRDNDTISVLRCLLADAMAGKIAGTAMCFKTRSGVEDTVFTGIYRAHPAEAAGIAMRLSWQLTKAQDSIFSP